MALPYLSESNLTREFPNRPSWTVGKTFLGYGVRFGLRANHAQALEQALAEIPLGWEEIPDREVDVMFSLSLARSGENADASKQNLLYADSELLASDPSSAPVLNAFAQNARLLTALYAKERLFVHAGVVGWRGQAILIPGLSRSGKTTLVHALVKAGATYYSDEFAVLDRQGYVHPYPLPLSIRTEVGTVPVPVSEFGGTIGQEPLPVKLVVITQFTHDAEWQPQPLAPSHALLALMENTVAARREPQFSMPVLRATVMRANTVSSPRGDAQSTAQKILTLVDGE